MEATYQIASAKKGETKKKTIVIPKERKTTKNGNKIHITIS